MRAVLRPDPRPVTRGSVSERVTGTLPLGSYGWDWSATTHDVRGTTSTVAEQVVGLSGVLGGETVLPGKGLQGWGESVEVFDSGGYKRGAVYFGGGRSDLHVVSTSDVADEVRGLVVAQDGAKTSRVDTRVDTLVPYDDLAELCRLAAETYNATLTTYETFQADGENLGRTLYLGSPRSMVRVRLYEKWLESPGEYVEGTNRVEVALRPPSSAKVKVSGLTRAETFCATRTTRGLAELLGSEVADSGSLRVRRGRPELERSLAAMGRQYGRAFERWCEVSGGDVGRVVEYLQTRGKAL